MKSGKIKLSRIRMRILATSVWYLLASGTHKNHRLNYFTRIEQLTLSEDPLSDVSSCRCGVSDSVMTRIVGGREADKASHPWQAALMFRGRTKPFCGGSLVTTR